MRHEPGFNAAIGLGLVAAVAVTIASPALAADPAAVQIAEQDAAEGVLTDQIPPIAGPKRVVAVAGFDSGVSQSSVNSSWDVSAGLRSMLITALTESGRFIVAERSQIQAVLAEQEMKASGAVNPQTGPEVGQVIGVNGYVVGSVISFGSQDKGGGLSLGASGGIVGSLFGGAVSQQSASGDVTIDVRYVDATTSEVLETHRVSEPVKSSSWDISAGYKGISLGTNQFYKTPLGEASRRAITKAVQFIARSAQEQSWSGIVVDYDGQTIYINAGSDNGLKAGDKFLIERIAKKFTDPVTGQVLSVRKMRLGIVTLTDVEAKLSYGSFAPTDVNAPVRGDLVVMQ